VGAIIESTDKKIIFGKRRPDPDINPGLYSIPAGIMDAEKDFVDGVPDPFAGLYRELWEEKSIENHEIISSVCLGIEYHTRYKQPYLPFLLRLGISSEQLKSKEAQEEEFTEFTFIDSSKQTLNYFINSNLGQMSQTCVANALLATKYLN
jgi:8-oxo-dGTP pyrophosphatase MutT (NUDIX family)